MFILVLVKLSSSRNESSHLPSHSAYLRYVHAMIYLAPVGFVLSCPPLTPFNQVSDSKFFALLYSATAYYFANRMMRLLILMGPVASILGGISMSSLWTFARRRIAEVLDDEEPVPEESKKSLKKKKKNKQRRAAPVGPLESLNAMGDTPHGRIVRQMLTFLIVLFVGTTTFSFYIYSYRMAEGMSNPSIMMKARMGDGSVVMVDDYREAYWWLRDKTKEDARVMAWWDYGYQITGIGNRTTIADGNTWNHEHIATLGRCLVSPEKIAHRMIRHIADYVLIWTGGGGDDLAKSPHLARIANSVYGDVCGMDDPTCRQFGFTEHRSPTPMMAASLLYKLHSAGIRPGVRADPDLFREVFQSKHGKVRIYKVLHVSKESKDWVADPANRKCDAPGSWYCVGQYPPKFAKFMENMTNFKQLEDFNVADTEKSQEYQRKYMAAMNGKVSAKAKKKSTSQSRAARLALEESDEFEGGDDEVEDGDEEVKDEKKTSQDEDEEEDEGDDEDFDDEEDEEEDDDDDILPDDTVPWINTAATTHMWELIHGHETEKLREWLKSEPDVYQMRSEDGRGPLWWAYENGHTDIVDLLVEAGASQDEKDSAGKIPKDMLKK